MTSILLSILTLFFVLLAGIGRPIWYLLIIFCIIYILDIIKKKQTKIIVITLLMMSLAGYNYIMIKDNILFNYLGNVIQYAIIIICYILTLNHFSDKENTRAIYNIFYKYKIFLLIILFFLYICALAPMVLSSGYMVKWGMKCYVGLYPTPHPFTYFLIFLSVYTAFVSKLNKNEYVNFLQIPLVIALFMTSARTPAVVNCFLLFGIYYFWKNKNRKIDKKIIISVFLVLLGFVFLFLFFNEEVNTYLLKIPILQKFVAKSGEDVLSGRNEFWGSTFNSIANEFKFKHIVFGHGIYYSKYLNFMNYGMIIWAHNDVIDVFISFGVVFLIIYLGFYIKYFKSIPGNGLISSKSVIIISVILLMLLNGIVNYPFFFVMFIFMKLLFYDIYKEEL